MKTLVKGKLKCNLIGTPYGQLCVGYTRVDNQWKPTLTMHTATINSIRKDGSNLKEIAHLFKPITDEEMNIVNGKDNE